MSAEVPRILFAGGGTVGHLAPGFALAEALAARGAQALFATPGEPIEATWFPEGLPAPHAVPTPRRPRGPRALALFLPRLARAVFAAVALLRRERPAVVVGLGGWPCVPGSLAALLTGTPLALITSDAKPGLVVRLLAPLARRVYAAQAAAARALSRRVLPSPRPRVRVTGVIVRPQVVEARREPQALGLSPALPTLFVVGGSLGAQGLNAAVVAGLSAAVRADPALCARMQVLHSTGPRGEGVAGAYADLGLRHVVVPYVRAVGNAYKSAALVLSRAGALTCAELEATGAPAVLVPYPHHKDRQQFENARPLEARGAALVIEEQALTPEAIAGRVLPLLWDEPRRAGMSARMASNFRYVAPEVAADLLSLGESRPARVGSRPGRAATPALSRVQSAGGPTDLKVGGSSPGEGGGPRAPGRPAA